jgi:hypothetical protein
MGCCCGKIEEKPDLYKNLIDPENVTEVEAHVVLDGLREVREGVLKKHTEYLVVLNMTGAKDLCCWKRYSDFESLHMRMKLDQPAVLAHFAVELPPKHIDDTEVRRQQLQQYMCRMVSSATLLWTKEFNDFLGCEDGIVQQISGSSKNIKDLWKQKRMVMRLTIVCPPKFRASDFLIAFFCRRRAMLYLAPAARLLAALPPNKKTQAEAARLGTRVAAPHRLFRAMRALRA